MIYHGVDGYTIDVLNHTAWKDLADDEFIQLQQFIGFYDKNKRKIFEKDYIKLSEGEKGKETVWYFKVIYVPNKACFSLESPHRFMDIMASVYANNLTVLYSDKIEVIGNEQENPEIEEILGNALKQI